MITVDSEGWGAVLSSPAGTIVGVRGQLHRIDSKWPVLLVDDVFCPYCLCASLFDALESVREKQLSCRHSNLVRATLRPAKPTATPKRKVVNRRNESVH